MRICFRLILYVISDAKASSHRADLSRLTAPSVLGYLPISIYMRYQHILWRSWLLRYCCAQRVYLEDYVHCINRYVKTLY
jgi:hypothetical protein